MINEFMYKFSLKRRLSIVQKVALAPYTTPSVKNFITFFYLITNAKKNVLVKLYPN